MLGAAALPTKAQDVYSFGIILGEIFGEDAAFQRYQDSPYNFTPTDILTKVLSGNLRPRLLSGKIYNNRHEVINADEITSRTFCCAIPGRQGEIIHGR